MYTHGISFSGKRIIAAALRSALFGLAALSAACAAGPGGLQRPNGVAAMPDGALYVMDFGHYRIAHLSPEGKLLNAFGSLDGQPGQIFFGWDIAADGAGNLYICNQVMSDSDIVHDGVLVFAPDGKLLREIGGRDYASQQETAHSPYGLDLDAAGRVYVADYGSGTVRIFDSQGSLLATLFGAVGAGDAEFEGISDVAVDDARGLLYVTDNLNSRVQQFEIAFDGSGSVTAAHALSFGEYGRGPGQFAYPQNAAVDPETGRLYVSDLGNRRVQVFDPQGKHVMDIVAPPEAGDWQVMGLDVGGDGAVYVTDALNNAIWIFERDGRLRQEVGAR